MEREEGKINQLTGDRKMTGHSEQYLREAIEYAERPAFGSFIADLIESADSGDMSLVKEDINKLERYYKKYLIGRRLLAIGKTASDYIADD